MTFTRGSVLLADPSSMLSVHLTVSRGGFRHCPLLVVPTAPLPTLPPQCALCASYNLLVAFRRHPMLSVPRPLRPPPTAVACIHLIFCCWHFRCCPVVVIVLTPPPIPQPVLNASHSWAVSIQAMSNTDCGAHQRVDQLAERVQHMGGVQRGPVPWEAQPAGGHAAGSPEWPV